MQCFDVQLTANPLNFSFPALINDEESIKNPDTRGTRCRGVRTLLRRTFWPNSAKGTTRYGVPPENRIGMTRKWAYGNEVADGRVSDPDAACYSVAVHEGGERDLSRESEDRLVGLRSIISSQFRPSPSSNRSPRASGMDGTASLANRDFDRVSRTNRRKVVFSGAAHHANEAAGAGYFAASGGFAPDYVIRQRVPSLRISDLQFEFTSLLQRVPHLRVVSAQVAQIKRGACLAIAASADDVESLTPVLQRRLARIAAGRAVPAPFGV
jgi:hypothetical protein